LRLAACALAACRGDRNGGRALPVPGEGTPRITLEVLNASGRAGLARLGTRVLREAGIDVVGFGNASSETGPLDSTLIMVRRGTADVGQRVRAALHVGRVAMQLDSTRLFDASVLLGRDFAPRLQFHP